MTHRRKKYLSAGLAGVLCSTALFGLTPAHADGNNNLTLPGLRERPATPDNSFTRMFPELPPFAPPTDAARAQAKKLGEKGGLIDALDNLTDPIAVDPESRGVQSNNPDNPNMTAGVTFFGQFLDHDITLDPRSTVARTSTPQATTNFRTAAFDLDSVYGDGPQGSPELYDLSSGEIKLKVEAIPVQRTSLAKEPSDSISRAIPTITPSSEIAGTTNTWSLLSSTRHSCVFITR